MFICDILKKNKKDSVYKSILFLTKRSKFGIEYICESVFFAMLSVGVLYFLNRGGVSKWGKKFTKNFIPHVIHFS